MNTYSPKENIGEQGIEMDRTIQDLGFDTLGDAADISTEETAYKSVGNASDGNPQKVTAPLLNAVQDSANTQMPGLGQSAMDITMRTRNG